MRNPADELATIQLTQELKLWLQNSTNSTSLNAIAYNSELSYYQTLEQALSTEFDYLNDKQLNNLEMCVCFFQINI